MAADPVHHHVDKLTLELKRGTLVLAAMSCLRRRTYGYALVQEMASRGVEVEQGTLYPLLRRLDEQGLLTSSWNTDGSRPRKYYRLSAAGARVLDGLAQEWRGLVDALADMLGEARGGDDGSD